MKSRIGMRSCVFLNSMYTWTCKYMFYKSWINWISNFNVIGLISQLLVQPLISLFQIYHVILLSNNGPIFGHTSKNLGKFLREFARNVQLSYEYNTWYHIIHALSIDVPNELQQCMLLGASYVQRIVYALNVVSQTFHYSMQPKFLALVIIQAMIVTESQILNCGSKGYCWSF